MRRQEPPYNYAPWLGLMAIVLGTISIWMGRTAISQGYLSNSGYNPRIGDETTGTTLAWVVIGGLLILAGIFPRKLLANRSKR